MDTDTLQDLPILHVPLCQMGYILPMLNKLQTYFSIKLYFITDKFTFKSTANLIQIYNLGNKYQLITLTQQQFNNLFINCLDKKEVFLITSWQNVFNGTLPKTIEHNKIHFSFGHGIDEEAVIQHGKLVNAKLELGLNASLYSSVYKDKIKELYQIDDSKKTLVIFETISLWLFKRFDKKEVMLNKFQENIVNTLINLKSMYNIILRFHPQDYYEVLLNGRYHCADIVTNNFIIDYTPLPVFNLYEIADVIVSSRFSAAGYQSLFIKNKHFVVLETDFSVRQGYTQDTFIHTYNNDQIESLKEQGLILSENEVPIVYENSFETIVDKLVPNMKYENYKNSFVNKVYGIDRDDFSILINSNILASYINNHSVWL